MVTKREKRNTTVEWIVCDNCGDRATFSMMEQRDRAKRNWPEAERRKHMWLLADSDEGSDYCPNCKPAEEGESA